MQIASGLPPVFFQTKKRFGAIKRESGENPEQSPLLYVFIVVCRTTPLVCSRYPHPINRDCIITGKARRIKKTSQKTCLCKPMWQLTRILSRAETDEAAPKWQKHYTYFKAWSIAALPPMPFSNFCALALASSLRLCARVILHLSVYTHY